MLSSEWITAVVILRSSVSGWCVTCKEEPSLPDENFSCAHYVQGLWSYKNCHSRTITPIYQTEVSRTIIFEFTTTQDYSEVNIIVIPYYFGCELNSVWVYLCIIVLWCHSCEIWPYCCVCSIVHQIPVYLVITTWEIFLIINSLTFLCLSVICSGTHSQKNQGV